MNKHLLSLLPILALLLLSCGGGGSTTPTPNPNPEVPPKATVWPQTLSANTGMKVRFLSTADPATSTVRWDFGEGAVPATSTEFEPQVTLKSLGKHTGTLTVCSEGCRGPEPFEFEVLAHENVNGNPTRNLERITPTGTLGLTGSRHTFLLEARNAPTQYEWKFFAGATPSTSTQAAPTVTLGPPGIYQGRVTIREPRNQETLSVFFAYRVLEQPSTMPPHIERVTQDGWTICDTKSVALRAAIVSDVPVTYQWQLNGGGGPAISTNSICRFTSALPEGPQQGTLTITNEYGTSAPYPFDFQILDCPDAELTRVFPDDQPSGPVYWEATKPYDVQTDQYRIDPPGIMVPRVRHPYFTAVLPTTGTLTGSVQFLHKIRRLGGTPFQIAEPVTHPDPPRWTRRLSIPEPAGVSSQMQIAFFDGYPLLCFIGDNQVRCAMALTANPTDATDWTIYDIPGLASPLGLHLEQSDGRPLLIVSTVGNKLKFASASTSHPIAGSDWSSFTVAPQGTTQFRPPLTTTLADGSVLLLVSESPAMVGASESLYSISVPPQAASEAALVRSTWNDAGMPTTIAGIGVMYQQRPIFLLSDSSNAPYIVCGTSAHPLAQSDFSAYRLNALSLGSISARSTLVPTSSRLWGCVYDVGDVTHTGFWSWTADIPTAATDWSSAIMLPNVRLTTTATLAGSVDDRLIECRIEDNRVWMFRALRPDFTRSIEWHKHPMQRIDDELLNVTDLRTMAIACDTVWLGASNNYEFSPNYELWSTTLVW